MVHRTTKACELLFRDFHRVTIPAGAPLRVIKGGDRTYYAVEPCHVETTSDTSPGSIWAHDTKHFYIYAPADVLPDELTRKES